MTDEDNADERTGEERTGEERTDRDDGGGTAGDPLVTAEQRAEALDALGTLVGVLARLLYVVAVVALKVSFVVVGRLIAATRYVTRVENRRGARRWLLLAGDRRLVVGGFVAAIFLGTVVLGLLDVVGVRESGFVTTMFSTIIAGLFSFVPIVIGVNQLTLSRLFGTPDSLRDRIDSVQSFRGEVAAMTPGVQVAATDPAAFTRTLCDAIRDRTDALAEAGGDPETDAATAVRDHVARVDRQLGAVERAARDDPDLFGLLLPMIDDDYSRTVAATRRLRTRHGDALPERAVALLEDLDEALVTLDVARQYFKTLYIQQELAKLSRQLAYTGTAALVLSTLVVMIYASGYPPIVHKLPLLLLVGVSLAGAFAPFAVLFAFVVRIATIVQRTSAPGTFTPPGERPADR